MKINQVSSSSNAQEKLNAMLAFILAQFKVFQIMEFALEPSTFSAYPVLADVSAAPGSVRLVNAALESFVFAPNASSGSLKMYGFENKIDKLYLNDLKIGAKAPEGLRRQIETEQIRLAKKVAYDVLYDMINGDGTNGAIYGFKNLVKDVADESGQAAYLGLTTAQVHASLIQVAQRLDLTDKAALRAFEEILTRELADMASPALIMNNSMFARMTSVAKELGAYTVETNDFGKQIDKFGNIPMVPVPLAILPQDETDGASADLSSIYGVEFSEVDGFRYATNGGFDFTDFEWTETQPQGKGRFEFYGQTKIEDMKKFKRFSRIGL